jgi:hypothetical protein
MAPADGGFSLVIELTPYLPSRAAASALVDPASAWDSKAATTSDALSV